MASPATRLDSRDGIVASGNGKLVFVQTIVATTTSTFTTLNTVTVDGRAIPKGALYVFQPDGDVQLELNSVSRTLTNTNSNWIPATAEKWSFAEVSDTGVNQKGRTAGANIQVFVAV
jgi:hypothetical protein